MSSALKIETNFQLRLEEIQQLKHGPLKRVASRDKKDILVRALPKVGQSVWQI